MPTLKTTKSDLKHQVTANVGKVLQELLQLVRADTEAYHTLLVLLSQYKRLQLEEQAGRVVRKQLHTDYGDLVSRVLNYIEALEEEDISTPRLLAFDIFERILVVAKSPERADYFRQFFPTDYFHSVDYDGSGQPLPAEGYDIVLYDDKPPAPEGGTDELLLHYLTNTEPVVLYFGRFSPLLPEYPEKAYATNSVFSLHARIRKLAEHLRYRRDYARPKPGPAKSAIEYKYLYITLDINVNMSVYLNILPSKVFQITVNFIC